MTLRFPHLALSLLAALAISSASCASVGKTVADSTKIKLEGIRAEDPVRQGLTVIKGLLGAAPGSASANDSEGLSIILVLYLENQNPFTLNLAKATYTFSVDGATMATGLKESKSGEMKLEPGEGKTVELPLLIFTQEFVAHVLKGVSHKGAALAVKGELTFGTALGEVTFPYSAEKKM